MLGFGGSDPTAFTNSGASAPPGQVAYQGVGGGQDSLTQFIRSTGNFQGKIGTDATATGQTTTASGVNTLQGLLQQYLDPLVSGDPTATANALQPQVDQITAQFDKVRQMLSDTAPRGGGKASALAEQPYQKIGDIATLTNQTREKAVGQAAGVGTTLAQTGMSEQQLGLSAIDAAAQTGLGKAGINLQESMANKQLAASLGSTIGKMLGGIDWASLGGAASGASGAGGSVGPYSSPGMPG